MQNKHQGFFCFVFLRDNIGRLVILALQLARHLIRRVDCLITQNLNVIYKSCTSSPSEILPITCLLPFSSLSDSPNCYTYLKTQEMSWLLQEMKAGIIIYSYNREPIIVPLK